MTEGRGANVYQQCDSHAFNPRYLCGTMKHLSYLILWGCFSARGLGKLAVLSANIRMNQYMYYELLNDHLPVI